jgi:hypothetical protein
MTIVHMTDRQSSTDSKAGTVKPVYLEYVDNWF